MSFYLPFQATVHSILPCFLRLCKNFWFACLSMSTVAFVHCYDFSWSPPPTSKLSWGFVCNSLHQFLLCAHLQTYSGRGRFGNRTFVSYVTTRCTSIPPWKQHHCSLYSCNPRSHDFQFSLHMQHENMWHSIYFSVSKYTYNFFLELNTNVTNVKRMCSKDSITSICKHMKYIFFDCRVVNPFDTKHIFRQSWPKVMGQLATVIWNYFSYFAHPLAMLMLSLKDFSLLATLWGGGGGSANENESLNNVMVTSYPCVK